MNIDDLCETVIKSSEVGIEARYVGEFSTVPAFVSNFAVFDDSYTHLHDLPTF